MSLIDTVRTHFADTEPVVLECRRCGTTVDAGTERCHNCRSEEIVRYDVS